MVGLVVDVVVEEELEEEEEEEVSSLIRLLEGSMRVS